MPFSQFRTSRPVTSALKSVISGSRFRDELAVTVILQGLGSVASFLVTVLISRRYGPAMQGAYASFRSSAEFLGQLLVLGMPQTLVYFLSGKRISIAQAATVCGAWIATLVLLGSTVRLFAPFTGVIIIAAVSASTYVVYRSVVLEAYPTIVFNVVSILPGIGFVGLALFARLHTLDDAKKLVVGAYVFAAIATLVILGRHVIAIPPSRVSASNLSAMMKYSLWCSGVPILSPALTAGTYHILQWRSGGATVPGLFSVPLVIVSTASIPVNLIGTVLFKRWSAEYTLEHTTRTFQKTMRVLSVVGVAATPITILAAMVGVPIVFGQRFASALVPCMVIALGTYALLTSRVLGTALLSFGLSRAYALITATRVALVLACVAIGYPNLLLGAAFAWLGGDILATALAVLAISKRTSLSPLRIMGWQIPRRLGAI